MNNEIENGGKEEQREELDIEKHSAGVLAWAERIEKVLEAGKMVGNVAKAVATLAPDLMECMKAEVGVWKAGADSRRLARIMHEKRTV